jgi:DNA polymerase
MNEQSDNLAQAARQLIETDVLLGGDYIPARRNPLPAPPGQGPSAAAPCIPPAPSADAPPAATGQEKAAALEALRQETLAARCAACTLGPSRTNLVFGEGSPSAELVFVGEAPGEEEDRTGRPFVGRAGELLTKMIQAMGLRREDVYICNMLKCRPPGNRTPNPQEIQACWSYLLRQLQIIRPRVIVTLGNPATQGLLQTSVGITRLRGQWQRLPDLAPGLGGTPVMPTFHPAYVLRQYTVEVRGKVWDDLKKVMERLRGRD